MIIRALFFLIFLAFSLQANARDIYRVANVSVFIEAQDSNAARTVALQNGETKAYEELVKRFLDYGYMDQEPKLNDKQIDSIISKMQVKEEKITDSTYSAKLDFWFNPIKTANLFRIKHKAGTPTRAKYLVIPVLIDGESAKVWEHEWLDSWTSYRKKNLLVPLGDLDDTMALKSEDVKLGDYKGVDAVARRYKAPIILIAKAQYIGAENRLNVKLEKLEGKDIEFYEFDYPGGFGVGAFELYDTASNDIIYRLQNNQLAGQEPEEEPEKPDYYRNYDFERLHKFKTLNATVLADDLAEWSRIRRKILKSEYIEALKVESFKAGEVAVTIKYNGSLAQLDETMGLHGLNLQNDDNKNWTVEESVKDVIDTDVLSEEEMKKLKKQKEEKSKRTSKHKYIRDE